MQYCTLEQSKQNNTWRVQSSFLSPKIGEQQVNNNIESNITFFFWKFFQFIPLLQTIIVVSTIEYKKISQIVSCTSLKRQINKRNKILQKNIKIINL